MYFKNTGKVTPATIELSEPGTYEVMFKKAGYEDKVVTVTVKEGETKSVSATLTPIAEAVPAKKKIISYVPYAPPAKKIPWVTPKKKEISLWVPKKKVAPPLYAPTIAKKSYIECSTTPAGAQIWIKKK